jgi:hypothetical protein
MTIKIGFQNVEYSQIVTLGFSTPPNYQRGDTLRNLKRNLPDWSVGSYHEAEGRVTMNLVCKNYLTEEGTDRPSVRADGIRITRALGISPDVMAFQSSPNRARMSIDSLRKDFFGTMPTNSDMQRAVQEIFGGVC